jgi:coatomer protein complex subunit alpha (xenin)
LAYLAAKNHGLTEEADAILELAGMTDNPPNIGGGKGQLLKSPTPILRQFNSNWPLLALPKGFSEGVFTSLSAAPAKKMVSEAVVPSMDDDEGDGWGASAENGSMTAADLMMDDADVEGGWDLDVDLDVPEDELALAEAEAADGDYFSVPTMGAGVGDAWCRNSALAADHAAAGNFDSAMQVCG